MPGTPDVAAGLAIRMAGLSMVTPIFQSEDVGRLSLGRGICHGLTTSWIAAHIDSAKYRDESYIETWRLDAQAVHKRGHVFFKQVYGEFSGLGKEAAAKEDLNGFIMLYSRNRAAGEDLTGSVGGVTASGLCERFDSYCSKMGFYYIAIGNHVVGAYIGRADNNLFVDANTCEWEVLDFKGLSNFLSEYQSKFYPKWASTAVEQLVYFDYVLGIDAQGHVLYR